MKSNLFYLATLFSLFNITFANAQMGMTNNGLDRRVGSGQYNPSPKKPEIIDHVSEFIKKLDKEILLDNFQEAVIKGMIIENQTTMQHIIALDIHQELKNEKLTELRNNLDTEIKTILSADQVVKFVKMNEKMEKKSKK